MFTKAKFICLLAVAVLSANIVQATVEPNPSNNWECKIRSRRGSTICQGTIVQDNCVAVPARCVNGLNPADLLVLAGSINVNGGQVIAVASIIIHPDWIPGSPQHDIALLVLASVIVLSPAAQPCALPPSPGWEPPTDSQIICSGWAAFSDILGVLINLLLSIVSDVVALVLGGIGSCPVGCLCGQTCIANLGASLVASVGGVNYLLGQLLVVANCNTPNALATFSNCAHEPVLLWIGVVLQGL